MKIKNLLFVVLIGLTMPRVLLGQEKELSEKEKQKMKDWAVANYSDVAAGTAKQGGYLSYLSKDGSN